MKLQTTRKLSNYLISNNECRNIIPSIGTDFTFSKNDILLIQPTCEKKYDETISYKLYSRLRSCMPKHAVTPLFGSTRIRYFIIKGTLYLMVVDSQVEYLPFVLRPGCIVNYRTFFLGPYKKIVLSRMNPTSLYR